jgi:hypothetical protein
LCLQRLDETKVKNLQKWILIRILVLKFLLELPIWSYQYAFLALSGKICLQRLDKDKGQKFAKMHLDKTLSFEIFTGTAYLIISICFFSTFRQNLLTKT